MPILWPPAEIEWWSMWVAARGALRHHPGHASFSRHFVPSSARAGTACFSPCFSSLPSAPCGTSYIDATFSLGYAERSPTGCSRRRNRGQQGTSLAESTRLVALVGGWPSAIDASKSPP